MLPIAIAWGGFAARKTHLAFYKNKPANTFATPTLVIKLFCKKYR
jgi:hypothetical protein